MSTRTIFLTAAACTALALGTFAAAPAATVAYTGAPDVNVTAAFYNAGGGPGSFSSVRAIESMVGEGTLSSGLSTLAAKYGQDQADRFPAYFDFVMHDAWERAGQDNLMIPPFGSHDGHMLAVDLLHAGTTPSGNFSTRYLLAKLFTPTVSDRVLSDLSDRYGAGSVTAFEQMSNSFFYDLSAQLGANISLGP
ncbi:MAG TPA: hypothetical protein VMH02_03750 [Verrucomicrobiae bacterium]|nr:hypothetical protein [Verrucomicrobiae bacterium]